MWFQKVCGPPEFYLVSSRGQSGVRALVLVSRAIASKETEPAAVLTAGAWVAMGRAWAVLAGSGQANGVARRVYITGF